jgi:adenine/guanine phosphoribosyltransferase-like PRPP-binding protein
MEAFYEAIKHIDVPKGQIMFAEHFFATGWDAAIDALSLAFQRQFEEDGVDTQLIRREPQEPPPDDDQE